jgi:hypothetical protein
MNVYSDFSIRNEHISHRTVKYSPGSYDTRITVHPTENLLEIKSHGHTRVKLKIPHEYIHRDGEININGSEYGENWNALGTFHTFVNHSEPRFAVRTCLLDAYLDGKQMVDIYGKESVIEHDQTTTRTLKLHFISSNGQSVLADLEAHHSHVEIITDQVTRHCHPGL